MEHLLQYQIIHNNYQHGFWQGYSAESQLITVTEDILYAMDHEATNRCYTYRLPKAFDTGSSTPVTSIQIIILRYSKSNIFLDKLLAHLEEATSNCRWLNFCMDSRCATGNSVRTIDVLNLY